jgi:ATP-dependent protease HslVU (ClpYQ) peptidase subunit
VTTVAWDGRTIAADRLASYGNARRKVRKLFDCGEYVYGCSGDFSEAHPIAEWLTGGAKSSERPVFDEEKVFGIAVRKADAKAFVVEGKRVSLTEILDDQFATGCGRDFARSAMAFGRTAPQAVAFASRFDVFTGLGVDSVRIRPTTKGKK